MTEKLKLERKDILSGKKKRELTDWWLQLIKSRVDDYLLSKDFDFDAVSNNYLDQPPRSFAAVKKNHRILLGILNPESLASKEEMVRALEREHNVANDLYRNILLYH